MLDVITSIPFLNVTTSEHPQAGPARASLASACAEAAGNPGGRALLEAHLDLIRRKLQRLGRQSGLPEHEAEELLSWAVFKLVEDDYRILAAWTGRSSFETYLTVVLVNLARDYRIHLWGKWRPSAEARRGGPAAVLLERLWERDGLSLKEAIERTRVELREPPSRGQLEGIAARLRRRPGRRRVGEEELERIPVDGRVEDGLVRQECAGLAEQVREVLRTLLQEMPAEDRLLLRLHFRDGLTLAAIAPVLSAPQRALYGRRDRSLRRLREGLERAGLGGFPEVEIDDPSLWV